MSRDGRNLEARLALRLAKTDVAHIDRRIGQLQKQCEKIEREIEALNIERVVIETRIVRLEGGE